MAALSIESIQPYNGVKTVEKSLRILELLLVAEEGLSIGQLVARTGMHRASVHRLLTTLHALGWVERPASRPVFRISLRLYALAHVFVQNYSLLDRLQPLLSELSRRTRETVHLGMLDGWEVLHINRVESLERVGVSSHIGSRGWAHTSSMGKALLAGQSDAFLQAYIDETGLPGMTERSITTPEAFWAEIATVRRQGFSIDNEEDAIGVRCLGTALPVAHGPAVLAVSITGPSPRFTLQRAYEFAPTLLELVRVRDVPWEIPVEVGTAS
ncbi:MAG TPA: IclR family transcriptional regulator [Chloroflexota bacterium]|nr:IclR family transcriptional regulator [Chloroflexota bacterium]